VHSKVQTLLQSAQRAHKLLHLEPPDWDRAHAERLIGPRPVSALSGLRLSRVRHTDWMVSLRGRAGSFRRDDLQVLASEELRLTRDSVRLMVDAWLAHLEGPAAAEAEAEAARLAAAESALGGRDCRAFIRTACRDGERWDAKHFGAPRSEGEAPMRNAEAAEKLLSQRFRCAFSSTPFQLGDAADAAFRPALLRIDPGQRFTAANTHAVVRSLVGVGGTPWSAEKWARYVLLQSARPLSCAEQAAAERRAAELRRSRPHQWK